MDPDRLYFLTSGQLGEQEGGQEPGDSQAPGQGGDLRVGHGG